MLFNNFFNKMADDVKYLSAIPDKIYITNMSIIIFNKHNT